MNRFKSLFRGVQCPIIGMVHVKALPGTPQYANNFENVLKEAIHDVEIYANSRIVSFFGDLYSLF